jgi:hypothetical protein
MIPTADNRAAVVVTLIMSATTAALLIAARMPFGEPHWSVPLRAVLLLGAGIFVWQIVERRTSSDTRGPIASYAATILVLMVLPLIGWAAPLRYVPDVVCIAVWVFGLIETRDRLRGAPLWYGAAAMTGVPLGVIYCVIVNGMNVASFLSPELVTLELQRADNLYHTALAALITKFGVISTGLDGLVPVKYHILSHVWFGLLARWLDVSAVTIYFVNVQIVALPLLFFAFAVAVCTYWTRTSSNKVAPLAILVPLALLAIVDAYDWYSYLISESYLVSLILLLLSMPVLHAYIRCEDRDLGAFHLAFIAIAPLLWFAKTSVGAVWIGGVSYLILRRNWPRWRTIAMMAIMFGALALVLHLSTLQTGHSAYTRFEWLEYFKTYRGGAWGNNVAMAVFALLALLGYRHWKFGKQLTTETFVVFCLLSLLPALTLRINGGSAYYFLNIGAWVALVFISASLLLVIERIGHSSLVALLACAVFLVATYGVSEKRNALDSVATVLAKIEKAVGQTNVVTCGHNDVTCLLSALNDVASYYPSSNGAKLENALRNAAASDERDTLVYIPPGFTAFWDIKEICSVVPLAIPGLSGLPMINGLPPAQLGCDLAANYAHMEYPPDSRSIDMSRDRLCEKTRRLGFRRVLMIRSFDDSEMLSCSPELQASGNR